VGYCGGVIHAPPCGNDGQNLFSHLASFVFSALSFGAGSIAAYIMSEKHFYRLFQAVPDDQRQAHETWFYLNGWRWLDMRYFVYGRQRVNPKFEPLTSNSTSCIGRRLSFRS